MTNIEKYQKVFMDCFSVQKEELNDKFLYQSVPAWDSVGHMAMVASLEDTFGIMLEMDDIIDFSSFEKGIETLAKYDVII